MTRTDDLERLLGEPASWTLAYTDGPTGEPQGAAETRVKSVRERLLEAGAPDADAAVIAEALTSDDVPAPSTRWVLARDGRIALDETFAGARTEPEKLSHGAIPPLVSLLRHRSAEVRALIVETGRDGARVTLKRIGRVHADAVEQVEGDTHVLHKAQAGRMSQGRHHRHIEEVWQHNQADVAEAVDRLAMQHRPDRIFVTGDVNARQLLLDQLGGAARELVVEIDVDTRADGSSDDALDQAIEEAVQTLQHARLTDARDRALAADGQKGASGIAEVIAALQQAQVDTLVLDVRMPESEQILLALDGAPWVASGEEDAYGADTGARIPAAEALARAAVMTSAEVLIDDDDEPAEADEERPARDLRPPLAALRWAEEPDQPAT